MSVVTALEGLLYFHAAALITGEVTTKKRKIIQNEVKSTPAGIEAQLAQKACHVLTKSRRTGSLWSVVQPYLWFSSALKQFQVLPLWSDGFATLNLEKSFFKAGPSRQGPDRVHTIARGRTPEVSVVLRFLSNSMLVTLCKIISNNLLYSHRFEWPESDKFRFKIVCFLQLLSTLTWPITKALSILWPQTPQKEVIEIHKMGTS